MSLPKMLILCGLLLVSLGIVSFALQRVPWLYSWFGNLPGDIRYESDRTMFYAPVTSMVIVSVVLGLILRVVQRFVR